MKVSRIRFWFCSGCSGVYKKENLEQKIIMYGGSGNINISGTLECGRCHDVYQVKDIYSGKHDLPKKHWKEFQEATGERIEL